MEEAENGIRKQRGRGNAVTRGAGPEQRKLSASPSPPPPPPPPPPRVPRWLILDRIVHRSSRRRCGVVEDDATASALAHDCAGRPVRASLRIADPPAVSRLYIHQKGRPAGIIFREPTAIAAHRGSILFRLTVPFEDPVWWRDTYSFPIDYFVYSCRRSSSPSPPPPSLTLLPPCFDGGRSHPVLDELCKPHRLQRQRCMVAADMGILCHGDEEGEFTVADLMFSDGNKIELCLVHNPPPPDAGSSMEWSVKKMQIPPDTKINTNSWMTDAVLPIGRCLCWVDNYQGILAIDVQLPPDNSDAIRYIPLPKKALKKSQRLYKDACEPDPLRSVCVTDAGIIKLVCILTTECAPPFTIKAWTLDDICEGRWAMDLSATMGAEKFFGLLGGAAGHSCLPVVQPSFPLVSLVDSDVICFLLEDKDRGLFWMVDVNMRSKKLQSSALYITEEEEEGRYPTRRGCRTYFFGHRFIPSEFSSFLSEDAITSRDLSEKMQKTKEDRVLQKSGLEEAQLECFIFTGCISSIGTSAAQHVERGARYGSSVMETIVMSGWHHPLPS